MKTASTPYEHSCGALVFRQRGTRRQYLLLYQRASHTWSFPKGHMEPGEAPRDTAQRELREETGLAIGEDTTLLPHFEVAIEYPIGHGVKKRVTFYLARTCGHPQPDGREIGYYRWYSAEQALRLFRRHATLSANGFAYALEQAEAFLRDAGELQG